MDHELILRAGDVVRIGERRVRVVRIETDRVIVQVVEEGDPESPPGGSGGFLALVIRTENKQAATPRARVELQAV